MSKEQKFYLCQHCGNLVELIYNSGAPLTCCGDKMTELVPNTTDASTEKHVPQVTIQDNSVKVNIGSVDHPMTEEHYICWIYLKTNQGAHRKNLEPWMVPSVTFALSEGEKAITAYDYCNLHGLWAAEIE